MPERLAELRRQRALIAEHLAWLDREIATSSSASAVPAAATPAPAALDPGAMLAADAAAKGTASAKPSSPSVEDELAAKHLPPPRQQGDIRQDVRRGCLLYFGIAAFLVAGLCALLIWVSNIYSKSHPPIPKPVPIEERP
jgi:hypothetical protein